MVSVKVVQPHIGEEINHSRWTAAKTLLEAFGKPAHSLRPPVAICTDAVLNDTHRDGQKLPYTDPVVCKADRQV